MKTRLVILAVLMAVAAAPPLAAQTTIGPVSADEVARYQGDGGVLRLLDNPAGTNAFARYTMQKFRLDKKYGFEMQIVQVGSTQAAVTAIQAGGGDVSTADFLLLARLRHAGVNAIGIGPMLKWADHIIVPTESSIRDFGDLKGKRVGMVNRAQSNWIVMRAVALKKYNFELEKDSVVHEGGIALLRGLIEQGQLDATFMYDNITPAMTVTGKFRVLNQMSELINLLGLPPDAPFLLFMTSGNYAAAHPKNVRAYMAAYREAVATLRGNDEIWMEQGRLMKMDEASIPPVRDEMREDLLSTFGPTSAADLQKTFDILLETAGPEVLGMSRLPEHLMTLEYQ
ncbi:MAG TPA: ABC transporter substrate-binding protein [Alphaproteobacteria bacterium]